MACLGGFGVGTVCFANETMNELEYCIDTHWHINYHHQLADALAKEGFTILPTPEGYGLCGWKYLQSVDAGSMHRGDVYTKPTLFITNHTITALSTVSPFHHDSASLMHEHTHSVIHAPAAKAVFVLRHQIPRVEIAIIVCGVVAAVILLVGAITCGVRKGRRAESVGREVERGRMDEYKRARRADIRGKGSAVDESHSAIDVRTRRESAGRDARLVEEMEMRDSPKHGRKSTDALKGKMRLPSVAEVMEADAEGVKDDEGDVSQGKGSRVKFPPIEVRASSKEISQEDKAPTPNIAKIRTVQSLEPLSIPSSAKSPNPFLEIHSRRRIDSNRPRSQERTDTEDEDDEGEFWDGTRYRARVRRDTERRTLKQVLQETRSPTPETVDGRVVPELREIWSAENCIACHFEPEQDHGHA